MTGDEIAVATTAAWVETDGVVYAAALPDGPTLVLDGAGAVVWRAVVPGGSPAEIVTRVAAAVGTSPDTVARDVAGFVEDLVAAGVLTRGRPHPRSSAEARVSWSQVRKS